VNAHRSAALAALLLAGTLCLLCSACHPTAAAEPAPEIVTDKDGATMRLVPAGEFLMGSEERFNESPAHTVYVDAFYLDTCEVTHLQWKRFLDANPAWRKGQADPLLHDGNYLAHWDGNLYEARLDNHPIYNISWHAAAAYAKWAGKRLPTEAEWERAAHGPQGFRFAYGNTYDETKANTGYRVGGTVPVGSYAPNGYGIFDLTGNVMEWCADWFSDTWYKSSPSRNPTGPETGLSHVVRGGSWGYVGDRCLTTFRFQMTPPVGDLACVDRIGFRCAMGVPASQ
jgi:sulfatase modifying factor 1